MALTFLYAYQRESARNRANIVTIIWSNRWACERIRAGNFARCPELAMTRCVRRLFSLSLVVLLSMPAYAAPPPGTGVVTIESASADTVNAQVTIVGENFGTAA